MPKVAIIQFSSLPPSSTSTNQNLLKALEFVKTSASEGAELIVFPEYFLSGIISDPDHHHHAQRAYGGGAVSEDIEELWIDAFRKAAVEFKVDILAGTIVEKDHATGLLHNCSTYIDCNGAILSRYQKRNLWHPEKDYLTAGDADHQTFMTRFGRMGIMICWDFAWPEGFRTLLREKVDIILIPTFWVKDDATEIGLAHNQNCESLYLNSLLVTRAFENECAIVFCNNGGKEEEGFVGCSAVSVPFKGIIAQSTSCEEEVLIVDFDLQTVGDSRKVYRVREDLLKRDLKMVV